jgi:hypothetical protein
MYNTCESLFGSGMLGSVGSANFDLSYVCSEECLNPCTGRGFYIYLCTKTFRKGEVVRNQPVQLVSPGPLFVFVDHTQ